MDEKEKWSEKDDKIVAKIVDSLMRAENVDSDDYNIMYNWLILIKERIGQNMSNIIHCPECKSNFHFTDSDIIEGTWIICLTCKNEICILE